MKKFKTSINSEVPSEFFKSMKQSSSVGLKRKSQEIVVAVEGGAPEKKKKKKNELPIVAGSAPDIRSAKEYFIKILGGTSSSFEALDASANAMVLAKYIKASNKKPHELGNREKFLFKGLNNLIMKLIEQDI